VGDFLDKPVDQGGLELSRPLASAVMAAIIVALVIVLPQRPGRHPAGPQGEAAVGRPLGAEDGQPAEGSGEPH
jgi:hypothetical protein